MMLPRLIIVSVDPVFGTPCEWAPATSYELARRMPFEELYVPKSDLDRLLRHDTPWPLIEVLRRLNSATKHLLETHDCDMEGHEGVRYAQRAAEEIIKVLETSRCDDCDPSFGCFDGSKPCSKVPR